MKVNNLIGDSLWTDWVHATTGIAPTRPGIFTFTATSRTTIDLQFDLLVGSDTGGSTLKPLEIVYYHIYKDDGMGGDFSLLVSLPGNTNTYQV